MLRLLKKERQGWSSYCQKPPSYPQLPSHILGEKREGRKREQNLKTVAQPPLSLAMEGWAVVLAGTWPFSTWGDELGVPLPLKAVLEESGLWGN